jgi:hypothetical protein
MKTCSVEMTAGKTRMKRESHGLKKATATPWKARSGVVLEDEGRQP